jgi:hypothetical protein
LTSLGRLKFAVFVVLAVILDRFSSKGNKADSKTKNPRKYRKKGPIPEGTGPNSNVEMF